MLTKYPNMLKTTWVYFGVLQSYLEKFVLQTLDPKAVRPLEFYPSEINSKMNRKDFLLLFQFILGYLLEKLPFYPPFIIVIY